MTYIHQALVRDRSLILSVDESLRDAAGEWMPSLPEESAEDHPRGPSIRVDRGNVEPFDASGVPSLALGRVKAWVDSKRGIANLVSETGEITALADLRGRVATVIVPDDVDPSPADFTSLLTITAALLLVRDGRTPVHAAAVRSPATGVRSPATGDRRPATGDRSPATGDRSPATQKAWLLCGDSHSGKSTTTANLIKAGWSYLSDDYVVLSPAGNGIELQGWPDDFHIDQGWSRGESTGVRGTIREADLPHGRRVDTAPLGGILFPSISANEPTIVTSIPPVIALERLIRQSPWLVADSESAGNVFKLLSDAASTRSGELRLGLDTFADPAKLSAVISEFAARET